MATTIDKISNLFLSARHTKHVVNEVIRRRNVARTSGILDHRDNDDHLTLPVNQVLRVKSGGSFEQRKVAVAVKHPGASTDRCIGRLARRYRKYVSAFLVDAILKTADDLVRVLRYSILSCFPLKLLLLLKNLLNHF